ncbi:unnamed protein product [Thelazia callipaeda]|uniref:GLOBIN domain-containing protein n=1 Tax=Thelazia callipaeda TaxID=103827 RepID=A0A0N5D816_THECL|nr:unnamed protein product [Thelazia callipaeda]
MDKQISNLSDEDKFLLRETWASMNRNIQKIAVNIFGMIFEECPDAKSLFPFTDISKKNSDFIKFHSLRFMQAIESVLLAVNDIDTIGPLLTNLGHVHGKLEERVNFKTEYWNVFRDCTLFHFKRALTKNHAITKIQQTLSKRIQSKIDMNYVIMLWQILLDFMIAEMTRSFNEEVQARKMRMGKRHLKDERDEMLKKKRAEM